MQFSEIKKSVIAVLTIVVTAGPWVLDALKVLPGGAVTATVVSSVLGVAGVVLHYLVPNTTTDLVKAQNSSMVFKPEKVVKASRKRKSAAASAAASAHHAHPKLQGGAHEAADPPTGA